MKANRPDIDRLARQYRREYNPDVEAALRRLHQRIGHDKPTAPPLRAERTTGTRRRLYTLSAAAAALLILGLALWFLSPDRRTVLMNDNPGIAEYVLPDGSQVILQEESQLAYDPEEFGSNARTVELTGQAYFDVVPDADAPFSVTHGERMVRVMGTAFNLRAVDTLMAVEVSEGTVELLDGSDRKRVSVKQRATVQSGRPMRVVSAPGLNHHAWRTGTLRFDDVSIREVLEIFSANWGIQCVLSGEEDCDFNVTGTFDVNDPAAILSDLAKLGGLQLRSVDDAGKRYTLEGDCRK